ncbi:MAG TPA: cytochrome b/b6 domain-containing protein [Pyrinomonadaceae bacterium]
MRRYLLLALVAVPLLFWSLRFLSLSTVARAQTGTSSSSSEPEQQHRDNTAAKELPLPSPRLQCQGCHGPGKALPYLAGAKFHNEAHSAYEDGFHAKAIQNGAKAATCIDCHTVGGDLTTMLPASDRNSTINRSNIAITCGRCHGDKSVMQGTGISDRPFLSYRESVHAKALARGDTRAAVCTDCHRSHSIRSAADPQSSISKINIPRTCGQCHQQEAREFEQSVHGQAVARGVSRSPVCTDCHGIHNITQPIDKNTSQGSTALATDSCTKCHEGVTLTQEFGVPSGRVTSYKDSYHGLASRLGSKVVANCASCHGVHNILPSSDPQSMISASNLVQTCGQCHVGASANFTKGKIHLNVPTSNETATGEDAGVIGTRWVRRIYLPLIFLTIGGMALHNLLIWRKKAAEKRRLENRTIVRLTLNQRIQHWLLLTSFLVLVLSGFALQYPDFWLAWSLGSEFFRRSIHRVAAVVMIGGGLYHLGYLFLTREGRNWVKDMLPGPKDLGDLTKNFLYYLGLKHERPKIARFGYAEKAEYWAVVWGTLIMGLTGLMIWFKLGFFGLLPRWIIDVALAIHFYEAVLATLAIVVWHFYHVIFDPDVYPINWAFYDGRVSEKAYREEHELAYDEIKERESERTTENGGASEPSPAAGSTD